MPPSIPNSSSRPLQDTSASSRVDKRTYEKFYYTPVRHFIRIKILLVSRFASKYLPASSAAIIANGRVYGRLPRF